ncbi:MAG: ribosome biogenesis factor YjgA [Hydrogenovibrio sp.]|uniref:ribosome biogenesis factor YjgA n=1 Tax=Hydrogenovibrio sp. TaxID=2065821 RepID=UPI00286FD711|nr:ribosome biogenesis factor YjgA [Hydrogenovibrio sp.]MDR9497673.1 ribosome biogenesis factor YjgA [Hydrogenovibrio sp.]
MVRARNVNRQTIEKTTPDWEQEAFESRTDIKKAAQAVTDLGLQLAELSPDRLKRFQLPDEVHNAVLELKKLKKGPAIKRQRQFVGKLLRQNEDLLPAIKQRFMEMEQSAKRQNAQLHKLELWRDRLVAEGDAALSELIEKAPQLDRSHLRQLIRNAQREASAEKPPKASRQIFQYLKELEFV